MYPLEVNDSTDPARVSAVAVREYGFHEGELAVQRDVGLGHQAARLEGMLDPAQLGPGLAVFLRDQSFAAITGRGRDGRLWTSPLVGPRGFLQVADPTTLRMCAAISSADPLHDLRTGQSVGLIVLDYSRRRRVRLNGTLSQVGSQVLTLSVEEAFGNCPQYIPQRRLDPRPSEGLSDRPSRPAAAHGSLTSAELSIIGGADTFLLGTTHPDRGIDTSHRGGPAGFVRVEGTTLWWPDYAGNNMFNSLGNLRIDPEAALLFLDFAGGSALHLNGTAQLVAVPVGSPGDDGDTGRRIAFTPASVVSSALAVDSELTADYSRNPPLSD